MYRRNVSKECIEGIEVIEGSHRRASAANEDGGGGGGGGGSGSEDEDSRGGEDAGGGVKMTSKEGSTLDEEGFEFLHDIHEGGRQARDIRILEYLEGRKTEGRI